MSKFLLYLVFSSVVLFELSFRVPVLSIEIPFVGYVTIAQLGLIILCLVAFVNRKERTVSVSHGISFVGASFSILILLFTFQVVRGVVEGVKFWYIAQALRYLMFYVFFYCLIWSIGSKEDLEKFLKVMFVTAAISAIINVLQFVLHFEVIGNSAGFYGDFYRTYSSGQRLQLLVSSIAFGSVIFVKGRKLNSLFYFFLMIAALFTSYSRSHYLAAFLGVVLISLIPVMILRSSKRTKPLIISVFFVALLLAFDSSVGGIVTTRVAEAFPDFVYSEGTFRLRNYLWQSRVGEILQSNLVLGSGYGVTAYSQDSMDLGVQITNDNGYANIVIVFGLLGMAIYAVIFFGAILKGLSLSKKLQLMSHKIIAIGISIFQIQILVISYVADNFFYSPGIITLVTSWALLLLMEKYFPVADKTSLILSH
jgi:hypothetical protein